MSAQPGDMVAGGGYVGEAVQFTGGKVGIAVFTDQAGQPRRIEFVPSDEVKVVKLAQDWNQGGGKVAKREQELAEQFHKFAVSRESPTWTR